jgi:hypothetical protein
LHDLEEVIEYVEPDVTHTPYDHPELLVRVDGIVQLLQTRYKHTDDPLSLKKVVAYQQRVLHLIPHNEHPEMPARLNDLGRSLQSQYGHTGEIQDLDAGISLIRRAVRLTPSDDPEMSARLIHLATLLEVHFKLVGDVQHLTEAIAYQQRVVYLMPHGNRSNMPAVFAYLGRLLQRRYEHTGGTHDLNAAIVFTERAVHDSDMPPHHSDMPGWLDNLARLLRIRHDHKLGLYNPMLAMVHRRRLVVPLPSQLSAASSTSLSLMPPLVNPRYRRVLRQIRSERMHDISDLDAAIACHQRAVDLTPDGDPDLQTRRGNVDVYLERRHE